MGWPLLLSMFNGNKYIKLIRIVVRKKEKKTPIKGVAFAIAGGTAILMCYGGWPIFISLQWYHDRSCILVSAIHGCSSSVTSMVTKKQIKIYLDCILIILTKK